MGTDEERAGTYGGATPLSPTVRRFTKSRTTSFVGRSRRLMFERKLKDSGGGEIKYAYRWGKMFRGEKKRLVDKVSPQRTYLAAASQKESLTLEPLYRWFEEELMILPFGLSPASEKVIVQQLKENPSWKEQLINFLWSIDITDIRDIRFNEDRLVFVHTNVIQHYASYFSNESLSLRRLTSIAVAMFEAFTNKRTLVIDDFGMSLPPYALSILSTSLRRVTRSTIHSSWRLTVTPPS